MGTKSDYIDRVHTAAKAGNIAELIIINDEVAEDDEISIEDAYEIDDVVLLYEKGFEP